MYEQFASQVEYFIVQCCFMKLIALKKNDCLIRDVKVQHGQVINGYTWLIFFKLNLKM